MRIWLKASGFSQVIAVEDFDPAIHLDKNPATAQTSRKKVSERVEIEEEAVEKSAPKKTRKRVRK